MPITVGLIKELNFISQQLNSSISAEISVNDEFKISVTIDDNCLFIAHEGDLIWKESLDATSGNFGIESCQQISQILHNKFSNLEYKNLISVESS